MNAQGYRYTEAGPICHMMARYLPCKARLSHQDTGDNTFDCINNLSF